MSEDVFTLFYAWQSDTPPKEGRNFIEEAATKALRDVHSTGILDKAPRLDKDTKGVPGMPDIANTILEKIKVSSAVLADLTFIGKDSIRDKDEVKSLPNPNVLLELGYAIAYLGWERIICVMNTHYGDRDELPFDLKHRRWPLSFSLSPDATSDQRKETKTQLIKELKDAIRGIAELPAREPARAVENRLDALESLVATMSGSIASVQEMRLAVDRIQKAVVQPEQDRNSPETRAHNALTNLVTRVEQGEFEGIHYAQGMLGLVVLPVNQPPEPLPLFSKENQIRLKLKPLYSSGWDHRRHGTRFVTFSKSDDRADAVSEITDDSIISAAGHEVISVNRQFLQNMNITEGIHVIPSMGFENSIVEAVHDYIGLFLEFGVAGPWIVSISLFNLRTSILYVGTRFSFDGRPFLGNSITPPPILVPADVNINNPQSVAQALRSAFDFVWREHNFPQSLNYGASGDWTRT